MINLAQERYKYVSLKIHSETGEAPQAEIVFGIDGQEQRAESQGSGPVDAVFKSIENVVGSQAELQLYSVNAITAGTESQGEVTVRLARQGRIVSGQGADTDILVASAKAYLSALNKLESAQNRIKAQGDI
jgi:2-isopropylmalate synthase